jgi:hypothetical protein
MACVHNNDDDDEFGITLAIVGSREFRNYKQLCDTVNRIRKKLNVKFIVSGGAQGADRLGEKYAKEHGIKLINLLPDWKKHGKKAGIMRNEDIVNASDYVLCFYDGESKGTRNTIERTKKTRKVLEIIYYNKIRPGRVLKKS